MENQRFEEYLKLKKIDPDLFRSGEPELWEDYRHVFDQVHPASFTAQKLFKINAIRRKYPLKIMETPPKQTSPVTAKPKMTFKPKIK